jgi:hypothetical protein
MRAAPILSALSAAALSLALAGCTGDTEDPPAPTEPAPTANEPAPPPNTAAQPQQQPPKPSATQLKIQGSLSNDPHQ